MILIVKKLVWMWWEKLVKKQPADLHDVKRDFFYNFNPLSANLTKWSNTLKQFVGVGA